MVATKSRRISVPQTQTEPEGEIGIDACSTTADGTFNCYCPKCGIFPCNLTGGRNGNLLDNDITIVCPSCGKTYRTEVKDLHG